MGLLTPLAVRLGGISWLPKLLPLIVMIDKAVLWLSRGRFTLLDVAGLPNVYLTVVGRKSGIPRTTPLLCVPHDGGWLIAGSYFGDERTPLWVGNLRAAETAEIRIAHTTVTVTSREILAAERPEMWAVMLRTWPNYAKYEARTDRVIPVFHLQRT